MERLAENYGKKYKITYNIFSTPQLFNTFVDPYNTILSTSSLIEHANLSLVFDNMALYEICKRNLNIETPAYQNTNEVLAQVVSALTSSMRFDGYVNQTIEDIINNLVFFPRTHFLLSSHAPIMTVNQSYQEAFSVLDLVKANFSPELQMVKCYPSQGKYMGTAMIFRGDVVPKEVGVSLAEMKTRKDIRFVDWCHAPFKCGINYQRPTTMPGGHLGKLRRSVSCLANSTAIQGVFPRFTHSFDLLYTKRAFVHWFIGEGMEEGEFLEARENIAALERDYEEIAEDLNEAEEEEN